MKAAEKIKKKTTIRVSQKDFLRLLQENERMTQQITQLQTRMTELVEENRKLKTPQDKPSEIEEAVKNIDFEKLKKEMQKPVPGVRSRPRSDIYID